MVGAGMRGQAFTQRGALLVGHAIGAGTQRGVEWAQVAPAPRGQRQSVKCALSKRSMTLRIAQNPSGQIVSLAAAGGGLVASQLGQRQPSPVSAARQPRRNARSFSA